MPTYFGTVYLQPFVPHSRLATPAGYRAMIHMENNTCYCCVPRACFVQLNFQIHSTVCWFGWQNYVALCTSPTPQCLYLNLVNSLSFLNGFITGRPSWSTAVYHPLQPILNSLKSDLYFSYLNDLSLDCSLDTVAKDIDDLYISVNPPLGCTWTDVDVNAILHQIQLSVLCSDFKNQDLGLLT